MSIIRGKKKTSKLCLQAVAGIDDKNEKHSHYKG